jgi:hypothetical protein
MASDLLSPVDSIWASARSASGSRRTLTADDMSPVYHDLSYGHFGGGADVSRSRARDGRAVISSIAIA